MTHEWKRLASVLRQVACDAGLALLCESDPAAVRYGARRYNRVRARLAAHLPRDAFPSLPDDAPPGDVRIAAHALALYLDGLRRAHTRERIAACLDAFWPFRLFKLALS